MLQQKNININYSNPLLLNIEAKNVHQDLLTNDIWFLGHQVIFIIFFFLFFTEIWILYYFCPLLILDIFTLIIFIFCTPYEWEHSLLTFIYGTQNGVVPMNLMKSHPIINSRCALFIILIFPHLSRKYYNARKLVFGKFAYLRQNSEVNFPHKNYF